MINNDGFYGSFIGQNYIGLDTATMVTAINTPLIESTGKYHRQPHQAFGPFGCDTVYRAPSKNLWSSHQGSAQELPNDNILICVSKPEYSNGGISGNSLLYEIDNSSNHNVIWTYQLYENSPLFRGHQYDTTYINNIVKKCGLPKH